MKPLIRWAGGKQGIVPMLYKKIPQVDSIKKYYEPFFGAGSLYFFNGFTNAVISDLNQELVNFYSIIRNKPDDFYMRMKVEAALMNKEKYYQIRDLYNLKLGASTLAQSVRFFLLNKYSFNGIYRVNKNGCYNVPFGKEKPYLPSLAEIKNVSIRLQKAKIICSPYEKAISNANKEDFVYLDPPYPPINETSMFRHYTAERFGEEDQYNLLEVCNSLNQKGVRFMMSNADTALIRELYRSFYMDEIEKTRFVSCKKERIRVTELIIRNYHE